jgi:hypothetical protein
LDAEGLSVSNVGGGFSFIEFVVEVTRNDGPRAVSGRNPQIGRSSIINDVEGLRRSSNGDGSVVLSVSIIGNGDWSSLNLSLLSSVFEVEVIEGRVE